MVEVSSAWECTWNGKLVLLVVVVILAGSSKQCSAQSANDAAAYLTGIETDVMRVAAQVTANFDNTCELAASCEGNCSRQACAPSQGDIANMVCKAVVTNPYNCTGANSSLGCTHMPVNFASSYVRLPTTSNVTLIPQDNFTICSQRMLDPLFQEISQIHDGNLNLSTWIYFGSVEGVERSFPGREYSPDDCTFEPRTRPWYTGATAVLKDLVILLDAGYSMGESLPNYILQQNGFTKFSASVNMINALLDTLTFDDRVSIITFSSSAQANLVNQTMTATGNSSDMRMQPLKNALNALTVDTNVATSDLQAGMVKANQTFGNSSALKIMLVITDGQCATDLSVTNTLAPLLSSFISQQVLSKVYSFDQFPLVPNVLSNIACSMNGTYERVTQTVLNPLWTLRSYFGIIAYWRLQAQGNKPYWTNPYPDSGGLGSVITAAYPAFASDNYTLIGVVGSDVLVNDTVALSIGLSSALLGRNPVTPLPSVTYVPQSCNEQLSALNTCPNVNPIANPICLENEPSVISFEERVCNCSQCQAPRATGTSSSAKSSTSPAVYGTAGAVGAIALIALAGLIFYCCRRVSKVPEVENKESLVLSKSPRSEESLASAKEDTSTPSENLSYSGFSEPSSTHSGKPKSSKSVKAAAWPVGNQALKRDLVCFSIEELEDATLSWSDDALVGQGACGSVYRAVLRGITRAIKRPHSEVDVAKSTFDKELDLLSKLNHRCLVRLIGYCDEEHVLVYEFMEYGTLEDCLHENRLGRCLSWQERLNIAAGASKGLEYLHDYATIMIIHGDVKPANILLDEKLDAHIADFGLSLSSNDQGANMLYATRMGGTPGYFDPEFASLGSFTPKSDVYSFGMVLLELFSGRKVVQEKRNISSWAAEMYAEDVTKILDPQLELPEEVDSFHSIVVLALQCVHTESRYRPSMKEVASKLSNAAADWEKFEHEPSPSEKKHPSRRQHPQYRPLSRPVSRPVSLDADELQDEDFGHQ